MKTFILSLIAAATLCLPAQGKQRTVTERDSLGNTTRIIELLDTVRDGHAETDTLSITTYDTARTRQHVSSSISGCAGSWEWDDAWPFNVAWVGWVAILGTLLFLGLPVIIIFLIFYYRNKSRKQKFLLMQQALASGQPLPKEFFKEVALPDNRVKGFKNIGLGIGLFIFLWALTDEFGLACIGLLVLFIGVGQLAIYYTRPKQAASAQQAGERSRTKEPGTESGDNKPETGNEASGTSLSAPNRDEQ